MKLNFVVPIKPVPQARPRFFVRKSKGFVGAYDPKHCKAFKEIVAWHAKMAMQRYNLKETTKEPVIISMIFGMGKNGKELYHTKKPDIDNLAKAVTDALKGIVYADDCQIVEAHIWKQYGEPEIVVKIRTLEEI